MTDIKQPTDADLAWMEAVCRLAPAAGIDSVELDAAQALTLVAALREARKALQELWASYSPEDYLEGEDADYGPRMLAQRKAWQRAARILKEASARP